jgi:hypothetical protein
MTSPRIDIERFRKCLAAPKRHHAEICLALLGIAICAVSKRRWENEDDREEAIMHVLIHMTERIAKYTDFSKSPISYFLTMSLRELDDFRDKIRRHKMKELPEE